MGRRSRKAAASPRCGPGQGGTDDPRRTAVVDRVAQGPTTPLSGTVVGPDGEPVAGADVLLAGMPVYDPPILARGRSDAEGRFTLERPAGLAGQDRFIAPILWVVKPGFRLAFTKFPGPMPGADEPVRVVLGPPGKAEVRVEGPERRAGGRREGAGRVVRPRVDHTCPTRSAS